MSLLCLRRALGLEEAGCKKQTPDKTPNKEKKYKSVGWHDKARTRTTGMLGRGCIYLKGSALSLFARLYRMKVRRELRTQLCRPPLLP